THLAQVWRQVSGAGQIAADRFIGRPMELAPPDVPDAESGPWVIEDVDRAVTAPAFDGTALLHFFNRCREAGCDLLFTGRTPPADWPIALADLASRLRALPAVGIGQPDDTLLAALCVKLFGDRQLAISPDVVPYVVARIERSPAAVARLVDRLDRLALQEKREITVPLVRRVLGHDHTAGGRQPETAG
ncbi:MAG: DNA replication protein, partial [Alphaproteobacteria bacterium]